MKINVTFRLAGLLPFIHYNLPLNGLLPSLIRLLCLQLIRSSFLLITLSLWYILSVKRLLSIYDA